MQLLFCDFIQHQLTCC